MNENNMHFKQLLQSTRLRHIRNHIGLVRAVQKDLEKVLPDRFSGQCRVLHIEASTLTISVRSSMIATQMRLITAQLLQELHRHGGKVSQSIKRIKIRMKPVTVDLFNTRHKQTLDKETAAKLEQLSRRVNDTKLALSLSRLSQLVAEDTSRS